MIAVLVAALVALGAPRAAAGPSSEARALASWDRVDLTDAAAAANLAAARAAGTAEGVDPYLLLYIAWHESRFNPRERTPESGGRESCGVMTPFPRAHCTRRSLDAQYLVGAEHLRGWFDACRGNARRDNARHSNARCALLGYAGGYRLIYACRRGPMRRRRGHETIDLCDTPWLFLYGADEIRRAVTAATTEAP